MSTITAMLAKISEARKLRIRTSPPHQALSARLLSAAFSGLSVGTASTRLPTMGLQERLAASFSRQREHEYRSTLGAKRTKTGRAKFGVNALTSVRGAGVTKSTVPTVKKVPMTLLGIKRKEAALKSTIRKRARSERETAEQGDDVEFAGRLVKHARLDKGSCREVARFEVSDMAMAELLQSVSGVAIGGEESEERVGGLLMLSVGIWDGDVGVVKNLNKLYAASHRQGEKRFVAQMVAAAGGVAEAASAI